MWVCIHTCCPWRLNEPGMKSGWFKPPCAGNSAQSSAKAVWASALTSLPLHSTTQTIAGNVFITEKWQMFIVCRSLQFYHYTMHMCIKTSQFPINMCNYMSIKNKQESDKPSKTACWFRLPHRVLTHRLWLAPRTWGVKNGWIMKKNREQRQRGNSFDIFWLFKVINWVKKKYNLNLYCKLIQFLSLWRYFTCSLL